MPKNKMVDLRNLLFETVERLLENDSSLEVDRAKAIAEVGKVIVDTARVEIDFMRETGAVGSDFISTDPKRLPALDDDEAMPHGTLLDNQ